MDGRGNVFVGGGFDAMRLELEETSLSKQDLQEDRIDGFVAKYGPNGELLHDLLGRHIGALVDAVRAAGQHEETFDTRDLASGIYVYRLEGGGVTQTGKVTVAR